MNPVDLLVVGAGPAGLAAAIRYKRGNKGASVVVVDKALKPGAHSLSGAVFEPACLDALLPGWERGQAAFLPEMAPVKRDEMYFLTGKRAFRIPGLLVPPGMRHKGDRLISLARLVDWLCGAAAREGVEVYHGFSAAGLLWEKEAVRGVRLVHQGLDAGRRPKSNFLKGEEVPAKVTVIADGARGVLSREFIARFGGGENPQVYSIGVKQVVRLPAGGAMEPGRVIHALGFPCRPDVFGGGFIYGMGNDLAAVGIILGLDWPYTDLNPQQELELFKAHPFVRELLKDSKIVEAGAKTIPEGGFYALPKLSSQGALLAGDAAGFVNMEKIKGVHYGILSGMAAADAALGGRLESYGGNLEALGVLRELRQARNFRSVFQAGLYAGAPLSLLQAFLPFRVGMEPDNVRTMESRRLNRGVQGGLDRTGLAALSRTMHREDEPPHLVIPDPARCQACEKRFGSPCASFCPVEVYRRKGDAILISASNCVHCGTCTVKCPYMNIVWSAPEGGEGPRYKLM